MNNNQQRSNRTNAGDLQRVIEPLASYLCASDRPRTALKQALAALFQQIEQTNRSAVAEVAFRERRLAISA